MKILVTGGCGFIGSAVVRHLMRTTRDEIVNVDLLTYAASRDSLEEAQSDPRHTLVQADIADAEAMHQVFLNHKPDAVMHLAAESHVDRSINGASDFMHTNIQGTYVLLEAARSYWQDLVGGKKHGFRFHHISTDEVFGELEPGDPPFTARTPYGPRNPYSATKAASDHLVRAWHHTHGLPTVVSNTCNNYGPYQFPEKLIPRIIALALQGSPLPIYGDGDQQRDWILVSDHAEALVKIVKQGVPGATYAIGARQPRDNLGVVQAICQELDRRIPDPNGPRERLITHVRDRAGHDFRYEIDPTEAEQELGWRAAHDFEQGLAATVDWYLANQAWWKPRAQL